MIKKRISLVIISIISIIFSYLAINTLIIKLTIIQFIGIEAINFILNYLQDQHKKKLLNIK